MLRVLLVVVLMLAAFFVALVFSHFNPGAITLDLMVARFEISKVRAFAITLALGWALGLLSSLIWTLKLVSERQRIKRSEKLARIEVSNLRSLPLQDAD